MVVLEEAKPRVQRAYLIAENHPGGSKKVAVGKGLVLGRGADCGYVVDDAAASRRHVEIHANGEEFRWRDLGSTNGTLVNGARMLEGRLKPGDALQIGESVFRFHLDEIPDEKVGASDSTLFKQAILKPSGEVEAVGREETKFKKILEALYAVINEIAAEQEPSLLIDTIVEQTATALDAQRCGLLFANAGDMQLRPCPGYSYVHIYQEGAVRHVAPEEIQVSHTVVNRVLTEGESVFFQDTGSDSEISAAESVVSLNLRSIICVPLRGRKGIFGILYLDTNKPGQAYSDEDLLLSTAIGNSAGLALENVLLQKEIIQKQRFEQELNLAWSIQEGFLIRDWPPRDRIQVYGETRPASTVGGDFYDFIEPGRGKAGILIGDVSGKGMPAALSMAKLLAEFRVVARESQSPAEVLARLNESFIKNSQRGIFCTMCYILLDVETGVVHSANAGHHSPFVIAEGNLRSFGDASGPPVGVLEWATWEDQETMIASGETILLYTDGIGEARPDMSSAGTVRRDTPTAISKKIEDYGAARLEPFLTSQSDISPNPVITALFDDVAAYCEPMSPHDDCTLIAMRYLQ